MTAGATLPRWDLTPFFPSVDSPLIDSALDDVRGQLDELENLLASLEKNGGSSQVRVFESTMDALNSLRESVRLLGAYLNCVVTTDTRNATAQAKLSVFERTTVRYSNLLTRFTAWVGTADVDNLIANSKTASDHAYLLQKAKIRAQHLMSGPEESLAAEMKLTGSKAMEKLHGDVSSQLEVLVALPEGEKILPMSVVRNLAYEADREVRRAGYEAEMRAWKTVEVPIASAMNSIKGEVITLSRRRKWASPLDEALFGANIDAGTLEAMMQAAKESFPAFRRYMQAKAGMMGLHKLAWFDMFAPVTKEKREWPYDEATSFVERHFRSYSSQLGDFARRSFDENWIDVPPTAGKVGGAYCMPMRADESRILMNYQPSFGSVSTLAHELGHAYHNVCLAPRTELQRSTPMTLAETASIFCETIIRQAALSEGNEDEQLAILEGSLQSACQVVVDITSRFLFERSVFEGREERELSPDELKDKMLWAQRETYSDGLDEAFLHPYMWAAKPHYYDTDSFYNYPYMFGFLFGLGLFAQYEQDPDGFKSGYDDLLSSTGLADAATLASRFGIDVRSIEFWRGSLSIVERDIDRFAALAN